MNTFASNHQTMNKSKRSKPLNLENGVDFISDMPEPVLDLILQGLPYTEEVVRTSVLSKCWRDRWRCIPSFPSLNLDCDRLHKPLEKPSQHKSAKSSQDKSAQSDIFKFAQFVSWALDNPTVDLDSFRLCCLGYYGKYTVHKWIEAAVNRNVKSLDFEFFPMTRDFNSGSIPMDDLPKSLIASESLESLRLSLCENNLDLPSCMGFQALRVLELNQVLFDHDLVEDLLNKCPLLEELSLIDCVATIRHPECVLSSKLKTLRIRNCRLDRLKLKISCPQLVFFEYVGLSREIILQDIRSLKKAVIHLEPEQKRMSSKLGKSVSMLLDRVSHVESLSLNHYCIKCIDAAHNKDTDSPAFFPKLKTLEVTTTIDAFTMTVLMGILRVSPILESFNLIIKEEHLTRDYWVLDEVKTRTTLTRHLKGDKFLGTRGEKQRPVIARFLLEHGNALEEIIFSCRNHEKSLKMMKEVSKLHKASSIVKLTSVLEE